jgi:hypothetical protein
LPSPALQLSRRENDDAHLPRLSGHNISASPAYGRAALRGSAGREQVGRPAHNEVTQRVTQSSFHLPVA